LDRLARRSNLASSTRRWFGYQILTASLYRPFYTRGAERTFQRARKKMFETK
jgi:hypothetical protein